MPVAEGNSTLLGIKKQVALGTPISGAGAALIEVRPSAGLALAVNTIESQMLNRSNMRRRARQGSRNATAAYDSELVVGNLDLPFAGVLGFEDPATTKTEADLTSVTITGTGTIATFAAGDLAALGFYAGRLIKFTNLATSGNDGVWVPILSVNYATRAVTLLSGILIDETIDSAFSVVLAKTFYTPATRPKEYYTVEEYLDTDTSKLGVDMRFNSLQFQAQANQVVQAGFGLAGTDLMPLDTATAPNFTSPVAGAIANAQSMTMLDGGVFANGVEFLGLTGLTMGISATANITPLLTRRTGLSVPVGMFGFAGQLSAVVQDFAAWNDFDLETQLSLIAMFRQGQALSADCVSCYVGDAAYAAPQIPIADGDTIQTLPLYAGRDTRGVANGYQASTMVISTSAP